MIKPLKYSFKLFLSNRQINKIIDLQSEEKIRTFEFPLTSEQYKIYIVTDTDNEKALYIGITQSSIRNRLRSGLSAKGQNGYHGYKWKHFPTVNLFVWCFKELNKDQIENIEAELAFIVREKTGMWPHSQNEIHFNNCYIPTGKLMADEIYKQLYMK